ncbi:MAG TPA: glutamate--tRNA ligase [Ilumatobacter sp.]|nr:glutamate--tRNA ligase [Ilumatobacter sp.]
MTQLPRYRFAPSPTGFFHVGGARTALMNWALARRQGGTFVLRIEDTDEARNKPEWTDGIISALAWLGINSDDPHFEGPLFQSDFVGEHLAAAQRLFESGHAYYCDMTPEDIQARAKSEGVNGYGGWSRDLGIGPGPGRALRFRVPAGSTVVVDLVRGDVTFDHAVIEDFVLVRGNGTPVFNLANVVDDITMRISHVVRAEEHLPNTPKQQMIWNALGHAPPVWAHVPVLVNEQRKKLSKRRDKVALEMYRDEGYLAPAMVNYLMTLGWSPGVASADGSEIIGWDQIEEAFRLEDVNLSPAFFDVKKLVAFNKEYTRQLTPSEFAEACDPFLPDHWDRARFRQIAPFIQERLPVLSDAPAWVGFLFVDNPDMDDEAWDKTMSSEFAQPLLIDTISRYSALDEGDWYAESLKATLEDIMARYDLKLGKAQAPVRVAVSGQTVGPPLFEALEVLGRAETLHRLKVAVDRIAG